jgi:hypothetical protein
MTLDREEQRMVLLELLARAHHAPEEAAAVWELRRAISDATVPEPVEPEPDAEIAPEG